MRLFSRRDDRPACRRRGLVDHFIDDGHRVALAAGHDREDQRGAKETGSKDRRDTGHHISRPAGRHETATGTTAAANTKAAALGALQQNRADQRQRNQDMYRQNKRLHARSALPGSAVRWMAMLYGLFPVISRPVISRESQHSRPCGGGARAGTADAVEILGLQAGTPDQRTANIRHTENRVGIAGLD
jgi:hypothetical protein